MDHESQHQMHRPRRGAPCETGHLPSKIGDGEPESCPRGCIHKHQNDEQGEQIERESDSWLGPVPKLIFNWATRSSTTRARLDPPTNQRGWVVMSA